MKKTAKQEPQINQALRQWTRGVSFTLAMGKAQVAVLVSLDLSRRGDHIVGLMHRLLSHYVTGSKGLQDRGLAQRDLRGKVCITEAGEHVVALLKITGIYDEIRGELEKSQVVLYNERIHG